MTEDTYEDRRPNRFVVIFLLLLIGSPGSLLIYVAYTNFTPLFLILVLPLTIIFVYGFVVFIRKRRVTESGII